LPDYFIDDKLVINNSEEIATAVTWRNMSQHLLTFGKQNHIMKTSQKLTKGGRPTHFVAL